MEAKDDSAFPAMLQLVEKMGLKESVVLKLHDTSSRFGEAKEAGYPLFGYVGSFAEATPNRITELGKKLDSHTDVLVIPANENSEWVADTVLEAAVATGIPVWVFGVHRRSELAHHFERGAAGAVVSSVGYLSKSIAPVTASAWDTGAISPGEMTRRPESNDYGLEWPEPGVVSLAVQDRQAFLTLGHLAPLRAASGPYQVDMDVRVDVMPSGKQTNVTFAFAHADDRYYEHRQGELDGYHALLRMDGSLELWAHTKGAKDGQALDSAVPGPAPVVGAWIPLRLVVTPTSLTWSRLDTGATVTSADTRFRGDYMHVGRSSPDGRVSLRRLRLT
jgi:hypothetical protein